MNALFSLRLLCHWLVKRRSQGVPLVSDTGTSAALGCALADQDRRVVLVTGDGSQ